MNREKAFYIHSCCGWMVVGVAFGAFVPRHTAIAIGAGALASFLWYGWRAWFASE